MIDDEETQRWNTEKCVKEKGAFLEKGRKFKFHH